MTRILAILGSGETTPTMVSTHQRILAALGEHPAAVLLDTPYGFQENADEVTDKAVRYFAQHVGSGVDVASLRRAEELSAVRLEALLAEVRAADWLFVGPGSPTYLARQWRATPLPDVLRERLRRPGATVLASAAAATAGTHAVPVYEIYKAGADPHWADGLDLLREVGLDAVCVPHFDNTDGGGHDTRYCYLGERRLRAMEALLPEGTWVLGVDEHTALVLDLDSGTGRVEGRGAVTVRARGEAVTFPAGTDVGVEELRAAALGRPARGTEPARAHAATAPDGPGPAPAAGLAPLLDLIAASAAAFDAAVAQHRALDAAEEAVALESAIRDWSTDVADLDHLDRARAELRRQVTVLARAAQAGMHEHRDLVAPHVEVLLRLRDVARAERRYADADAIRDALVAGGVEVRDTPEGAEWAYDEPTGPG